jgi:hypothetical protein
MADYTIRSEKAEGVFHQLYPTLIDRTLRKRARGDMFKCSVVTILLYGSECWALTRKDTKTLEKTYHKLVCMMAGVRRIEHEPLSHTLETHGLHPLQAELRSRRLQWLGHLSRLPSHRLPKIAYSGWPVTHTTKSQPTRGTGWRKLAHEDLAAVNVTLESLEEAARNRGEWLKKRKQLFDRAPAKDRTCYRCTYIFESAERLEEHLLKSTRCNELALKSDEITLKRAIEAGQAQQVCPIQ